MFKKIAVSAGLLAVAGLWFAPSLVGSANGQTAPASERADVDVVKTDGRFFDSFRLQLTAVPRTLPGGISEAEAAKIALARGAAIREARKTGRTLTKQDVAVIGLDPDQAAQVLTRVAATEAEITPASLEVESQPTQAAAVRKAPVTWTVTGSTVNLRAGPGTNHAVISQASFGEAYRPISDTDSDWIQIELADGSSAWIFAKFFAPADG